MLFLLRNIRRKLLNGNKIGTYLLYAFGEIFLVVVGILIAVQIDDWSDQKKLQSQEALYLSRLLAENRQDLENISELQEIIRQSMESIDGFCTALNNPDATHEEILTSATDFLAKGSLVPIFKASSSTFDDLSNTGNIKVIKNDQLRDQIIGHYASIKRVQERMSINNDWALSLDIPFYYENNFMQLEESTSHLFPEKSKTDLVLELRKNKLKYINNAATGYWVDKDAQAQLAKLSLATSRLIDEIEQELKKVQ